MKMNAAQILNRLIASSSYLSYNKFLFELQNPNKQQKGRGPLFNHLSRLIGIFSLPYNDRNGIYQYYLSIVSVLFGIDIGMARKNQISYDGNHAT